MMLEELVTSAAIGASLVIEAIAIAIVFFGALEAFVRVVRIIFKGTASHGERKVVWRRFGMWLILGLEFELAADIIATVVAPSWEELGKLGAIAVVRTFLNYFLEKDLEAAESEP